MGKGGKVLFNHSVTRKTQSKKMRTDESDEDYTMEEDEECNESDEYCSSLDGDASEESLGEFEEDEDEEEERKVKRVVRSKAPKGISNRKRSGVQKPRKKKRVSYKEEEGVNDDDYEDDDDEFMPDEFDCVDDEEELFVMKKNKPVDGPRLNDMGLATGWNRKRKRNSKVLKSSMMKKPRTKRRLRRKASSWSDGKSSIKNATVEKRSKKISGPSRRRRLVTDSDSDFESSGSSNYEYTISEEEREQVREANEFCRSVVTSLRSSSSSRRLEGLAFCKKRKCPARKGKEMPKDLKNEIGKQVCGICLSEEGKQTVRGTLNCCSHYFCFACILEWSKVESRCPLCKQRFVTISKPARSDTGFDLRTVVIQVPERDQVYQPSEEELRGFLDPYENVICTECLQGGDDALMLLCDLCDSPAHTYCVGLGRVVPGGNWYCEGCRAAASGSSNAQILNPIPDQRRSNDMSGTSTPVAPAGGGIDLNVMYVPDTPLTQETRSYPSSRHLGDFQTALPTFGSGAFTVSERRRIQHQILNNRLSQSAGRSDGISANSLFGSQIGRARELATRHIMAPERVAASQLAAFESRFHDNAMPLLLSRDYLPAQSSHSRGQFIRDLTSTTADASVTGMLQAEFTGINSRLNYE